jgi:hypothetical protein
MGKLTEAFDKIADALVPKEIAGILGPASMMFAGPLGMPTALLLGQLGSAKLHSGRLDPYTALGTVLSAQGFKARNPEAYGQFSLGNLGRGIGNFFDQNELTTFRGAFQGRPPVANVDIAADLKSSPIPEDSPAFSEPLEMSKAETFSDKAVDFLDQATQSAGETLFPGFTDAEGFNFSKALTTIGSVTTLSALTPMAEELKKQRMRDKAEEGKLYRQWFDSYKRVSGRDYAESPFPDPELIEKYREFMMAEGGRVGYNTGGGIMDAAPGVPPGMELDYRDSGGFIPMGSQEKKDDVPAVLAKNEFVLTSDAMKGLDRMMGGSGDPRAAAKYMYQMMDQLEAMA